MTEEAICKSENMSIAITQSEGKRIKSIVKKINRAPSMCRTESKVLMLLSLYCRKKLKRLDKKIFEEILP